MVSTISNAGAASFNSAILSSVAGASNALSASTANQEALLEAELATYTQELTAASSGDPSHTPGALNAQQLQQQIASIQQQLNQLSAASSATISIPTGSLINTFT